MLVNSISDATADAILASFKATPGATDASCDYLHFARKVPARLRTTPPPSSEPALLPSSVPTNDDAPHHFSCRTLAELDRDVDARFAAVGSAWIAVAREIAQSNLALLSAPLQLLQQRRATLDQAVSAAAKDPDQFCDVRDRAATALAESLETVLPLLPDDPVALGRWRSSIDSSMPVAFRTPAADIGPHTWREILADYDRHTSSEFNRLKFDDRLHAEATLSLSMLLDTLPTQSDIDVMREELINLRRITALYRDRKGRSDAASESMKQAKKSLRRSKSDLADAEDDGEDESKLVMHRAKVSSSRAALIAAKAAMRDVQHDAILLAGSIYPEIATDAGLPHGTLADFDDVEPMQSSNHPMRSAIDPSANPPRAVVLKEFFVSKQDLSRFRNELLLLERLSECDGVVNVLSSFIDGDRAFIVMPRYAFGSLLQWVNDKNPSTETRLLAAHRIGSALERIHAAGVIHCDIKPENVFVDDDGLPVIGDFDVKSPAPFISSCCSTDEMW